MFEEGAVAHVVADGAAGFGADVGDVACGDVEGDGDGDVGFVEVGDVVDEGPDVSGVDEAEAGCAAECDDDGVDDAVEAGVGGGEGFVDRCAGVEVVGVVVAALPVDAGACGVFAVEAADAGAFASAELLHGQAGGVLAGEAHGVHLAGHAQSGAGVGHEVGLDLQQAGGAGQGAAVGVVAHAVFADPDGGGAAFGEQHHGLLGDVGAGAEEQCAEGGGGDVDGSAFVGGGDGVVVAVDDAVFQVEERQAVLGAEELGERDGAGAGDVRHGTPQARRTGARVSRPQP